MSGQRTGVLGSFDYLDSTIDTIKELRAKGFDEITAFAPYPDHDIEHALGYGKSPIRIFTLVGALTGASTGLAFTTFASMDWPLVTGGKPILSIPAYIIPTFEMTILFGALFTVFGVFWNMRIPDIRSQVVYDPEFSAGRYGVYVTAASDRIGEARQILESYSPARLQDDSEGAAHG
jgi:hypothetical protein